MHKRQKHYVSEKGFPSPGENYLSNGQSEKYMTEKGSTNSLPDCCVIIMPVEDCHIRGYWRREGERLASLRLLVLDWIWRHMMYALTTW